MPTRRGSESRVLAANGRVVDRLALSLPGTDHFNDALLAPDVPASGQEFALLPPDNATGNFTKIVQRIPVKILLDDHHADLRPGMSVIPSIQTKAAVAVAAPQPNRARTVPPQLASNR